MVFPIPGFGFHASQMTVLVISGKALINVVWAPYASEIPRAMVRQLLLPSQQEVLIPEMKWRKVCPASRSLSLPDNILRVPRVSMDSTDSFFPSGKPPGCGEFRGLVHGNCWQRPGFSSSPFSEKGSSQ